MCRPSDLIGYSGDPLAAIVLDKAIRMYGSFVDSEVKRFANASRESGGTKKKIIRPTEQEIIDYGRALIDGQMPKRAARQRLGGRENRGGGSAGSRERHR